MSVRDLALALALALTLARPASGWCGWCGARACAALDRPPPCISLYLPVSPCVSLCLPGSPYISPPSSSAPPSSVLAALPIALLSYATSTSYAMLIVEGARPLTPGGGVRG